ncbi:hypothetical protein N9W89_14050 [Hellea sp.]|nr:hypothetical protein [Hellea sp.]
MGYISESGAHVRLLHIQKSRFGGHNLLRDERIVQGASAAQQRSISVFMSCNLGLCAVCAGPDLISR